MQMTRNVLAWSLARGLLVDLEQLPVAYDSPVPIDMNRRLKIDETSVDSTHNMMLLALLV